MYCKKFSVLQLYWGPVKNGAGVQYELGGHEERDGERGREVTEVKFG